MNDDSKLDRLLRDVPIPNDLKSSLHSIPEQETVPSLDSFSTQKQITLKLVVWIALAAAVTGVIVFFAWPEQSDVIVEQEELEKLESDKQRNDAPENKSTHQKLDKPDLASASNATAQKLLDRMKSNAIEMDLLMLQIEASRLDAKIANIDSASTEISDFESAAITLSLAGQVATDFGSSVETVRKDMHQVIAEFPDSQGAEIARSLLEQTKQSKEF